MKTRADIMPFGEHLEELRRRLIYALLGVLPIIVLFLALGGPLLEVLLEPAERALRAAGQPPRLLATGPAEVFGAYLKVAMIGGVLASAPWILYQAWLFVAPGLHGHERRFVYLLIPGSALLTALAAAFLYAVMMPLMLLFFISFGAGLAKEHVTTAPLAPGVVLPTMPALTADPPEPAPGAMWFNRTQREMRFALPTADGTGVEVLSAPMVGGGLIAQHYRVSEYLSLFFAMALVFTVTFQLPLVMLLLGWLGIFTPADFAGKRKAVVMGCAIVGAVLTPADPVSMIFLAVPLYLLFEVGLALMRFAAARRTAGAGAAARTDGAQGDE